MASIQINDVSKHFRLYKNRPGSVKEMFTRFGDKRYEDFWALKNVDLEVQDGTVHGLIGHNGCGKSTLLRLMAGIHSPTSGEVITNGRISALLELGAGFHPELTGRENVYLNASIMGLSRKQTDAIFDRVVEFSGLSAFIDSPVKHYSSGMFVRLGFSVAVHVEPEILLIDEVIAVGDEEFQRRCLDHLAALKHSGVTIVLVTHSMGVVQNMCDHVTWIDHGQVVATGDPVTVVADYLQGVNDKETRDGKSDGFVAEDSSALVKSIEVLNADGHVTPFAVNREPLIIRTTWRGGVSPEAIEFALEIVTESGIHLGTARVTPPFEGAIGDQRIDYRFDYLPIAPGNYTVRVHPLRASTRSHLVPPAEFSLQIRPSGHIIEGMIELPGNWERES